MLRIYPITMFEETVDVVGVKDHQQWILILDLHGLMIPRESLRTCEVYG